MYSLFSRPAISKSIDVMLRRREDPLPQRQVRQDVIGEMRRHAEPLYASQTKPEPGKLKRFGHGAAPSSFQAVERPAFIKESFHGTLDS